MFRAVIIVAIALLFAIPANAVTNPAPTQAQIETARQAAVGAMQAWRTCVKSGTLCESEAEAMTRLRKAYLDLKRPRR